MLFLILYVSFWFWFALATKTTSELPAPTPSTIVDVLSADAEFSYFLRHLQTSGLIPVINTLQNVTVLAPMNLAFVDGHIPKGDSALQYFLTTPVRPGYLGKNSGLFETLLKSNPTVTISPDLETQEYVVDDVASIVEYDLYAKHQKSFVQVIDHLLPIKPSMCEVLMKESYLNGHSILFIHTLFATAFKKGLQCPKFAKDKRTLFIPTDDYIKHSLSKQKTDYYLALSETMATSLTKSAAAEIKADIVSLLLSLMVPDAVYGLNGTDNIYNNGFTNVNVSLHNDSVVLQNSVAASSSLVLSDGVFHLFDPASSNFFDLFKSPVITLTPGKAMLSMGYSHFVRELLFRKLGGLIDGSTANQTIFLELDRRDDMEEDQLLPFSIDSHTASVSAKQALLYHFVDELVDTHLLLVGHNNTLDHLLPSKFCSKNKIGSCYKIKMFAAKVSDEIVVRLNDDIKVIDGPFPAFNNNMIYIVDKDVETPSSFKHALGDLISNGVIQHHLEHIEIDKTSCFNTLNYLNQFDLFDMNSNSLGYSIFLPCAIPGGLHHNSDYSVQAKGSHGAWDSLGLLLNHLEANPKKFKDLLLGFFVEDIIYSDFGLDDEINTTMVTRNMRGDSVFVSESFFDGDFSHQISINQTQLSIPLNSDILFNQGVIHIVDKVLIPDDFSVSMLDLIKTTEDKNFPQFGILKLLDMYPKLKKALTSKKHGLGEYSLLVPSPESLLDFNITTSFENLFKFLEFHLIPLSSLEPLLDCVTSTGHFNNLHHIVQTNLSNTQLRCRHDIAGEKHYLRLEKGDLVNTLGYNKDHEVKILLHGCTSFNQKHNVSCVFLIDKPLDLKWLEDQGFLHVHLGFISIGIGILLGVMLFGGIMLGVALCVGRSKSAGSISEVDTPEPTFGKSGSSYMRVMHRQNSSSHFDHGYETDDDRMRSERDPLLPPYRSNKRNHGAMRNHETAPVSIKANHAITNTNRDRNLPMGF